MRFAIYMYIYIDTVRWHLHLLLSFTKRDNPQWRLSQNSGGYAVAHTMYVCTHTHSRINYGANGSIRAEMGVKPEHHHAQRPDPKHTPLQCRQLRHLSVSVAPAAPRQRALREGRRVGVDWQLPVTRHTSIRTRPTIHVRGGMHDK